MNEEWYLQEKKQGKEERWTRECLRRREADDESLTPVDMEEQEQWNRRYDCLGQKNKEEVDQRIS